MLYPAELRARGSDLSHLLRVSRDEFKLGLINVPREARLCRGKSEVMRPAGFEPATCGLGNRRSILLSYERVRRIPPRAWPRYDDEA